MTGELHEVSAQIGRQSGQIDELLRQTQGIFRKLDETRDAVVTASAKAEMGLAILRQDHEALHAKVHQDIAPKVAEHDSAFKQGKGMATLGRVLWVVFGASGAAALLAQYWPKGN